MGRHPEFYRTLLMLPPVPLPQRDRAELLDLNAGSIAEVRRSLGDIRRINRWLGGARVAVDAVFELLEKRGLRRATILDVGTGSADIPLCLQKEAARRDIELQIYALDLSARHLQIAREDVGESAIHLLRGDAFALPFRDESVDVVCASLFLHHFRAPEIKRLLNEWNRVARVGIAANDLERDAIPLWFFRLARPVFAHSFLTRFDGEASIRRAYTRAELETIARAALPDSVVRAHFPYRLSLLHSK